MIREVTVRKEPEEWHLGKLSKERKVRFLFRFRALSKYLCSKYGRAVGCTYLKREGRVCGVQLAVKDRYILSDVEIKFFILLINRRYKIRLRWSRIFRFGKKLSYVLKIMF